MNLGKTIQAVCETLGVTGGTVRTWRDRYQAQGLSLLSDQPCSGRPLEIDGGQRAKVTALACSEAPSSHAQWCRKLL